MNWKIKSTYAALSASVVFFFFLELRLYMEPTRTKTHQKTLSCSSGWVACSPAAP